MSDTARRLLLRVTLKLFTLTALLVIAAALLTSGGKDSEQPAGAPTLKIPLQTLKLASPQRIEWAGGPLQLLRLKENGHFYLFYDRGGNLGCPMSWQPPGSPQAPQQNWHGGFRDQCSSIWYSYDGTVLPAQAVTQNLSSPPYRVIDGDLLEIGVNGDNAAPATPPDN